MRAGAGDLEALARELVAQRLGVGEQPLDAPRLLHEQLERGHGGRHGDRRRRRRVQQRAGAVDQVARGHVVAAREAAVGAERRAERAGDDVDLVLEPGLGHRAAAAGADRPERLRLVDQHAHVVAAGELDDVLERRDVAVEAEHAVGGDQRPAAVALREAPGEVLGVGVPVGERLGSRQPAAVDDRRVRELVVEDDLALARQRGDHAEIGERARAEDDGRVGAQEAGEPLLEPAVQRHRAGRHLRRARADAPAHGRVRGRLAHARVVGEPEAVARAQHQHRPPVEHHPRALRPAHHAGASVEAELLELVQAVVEIQHPRSFGKAEDVPRATVRCGPDGSTACRPCTCAWRRRCACRSP